MTKKQTTRLSLVLVAVLLVLAIAAIALALNVSKDRAYAGEYSISYNSTPYLPGNVIEFDYQGKNHPVVFDEYNVTVYPPEGENPVTWGEINKQYFPLVNGSPDETEALSGAPYAVGEYALKLSSGMDFGYIYFKINPVVLYAGGWGGTFYADYKSDSPVGISNDNGYGWSLDITDANQQPAGFIAGDQVGVYYKVMDGETLVWPFNTACDAKSYKIQAYLDGTEADNYQLLNYIDENDGANSKYTYNNFNLFPAKITYQIKKNNVVVSPAEDTYTYDGNAYNALTVAVTPYVADEGEVTAAITGWSDGENVIASENVKNVGAYNAPVITLSGDKAGNYYVEDPEDPSDDPQFNLTINKADITGTITQDDWQYGMATNLGAKMHFTPSVVAGNEVGADLSWEFHNGENWVNVVPLGYLMVPGDYTIRVTVSGNANYNDTTIEGTATVTKAKLYVDLVDEDDNGNLIYNGNARAAAVTYHLWTADGPSPVDEEGAFYVKQNLAEITANEGGTNVGNYSVTIEFLGGTYKYNSNQVYGLDGTTPLYYNDLFSFANSNTDARVINYRIAPATLTSSMTVYGKVYDKTAFTAPVLKHFEYAADGETSFYKIYGFVNSENLAEFGNGSLTYTPTIKYATVGNTANWEEIDENVWTSDVPVNAGAYYIWVVIDGIANYNKIEHHDSFTIQKKVVEYNWSNDNLTYTGLAQKPVATVTNNEEGDEVIITVTGEQTNYNAEAYTATATFVSNPNYKLPDSGNTHNFTIGKAELTVTATSQNITYGDEAAAFEYTITGFVNDEPEADVVTGAPVLTCAYAQYNDVDSYAITVAAGTLAADNYSFTLVNGAVVVAQKAATITVGNVTTDYLVAGDLDVTDSGIFDDDLDGSYTVIIFSRNAETYVISGDLSGSLATLDVGTYYITIATNNANYAYTIVNKAGTEISVKKNPEADPINVEVSTYTINKIDATFTAPTSKSPITYNGEDQVLVNAGSTNGGTILYMLDDGDWTDDVANIKATAAGNYNIYYKLDGGNNYNNVALANINLTIQKYTITVTPNEGQGKTYGDDDDELTYTTSDTIGKEEIVLTGALAREAGENAGIYAISLGTLALTDAPVNANYKIELAAEIEYYVIDVKELTITFSTEAVYNGQNQKPTVQKVNEEWQVTGLQFEDAWEADVDVHWTDGATTDAGTYNELNFAFTGTKAGNYTHATFKQDFEITRRPLTVTWALDNAAVTTGVSVDYTGIAHNVTAVVASGLVGNDEVVLNVTGDTTATNANNNSTYTVTLTTGAYKATGSENYNYTIPADLENKTFTWTIYKASHNATISIAGWTYGETESDYVISDKPAGCTGANTVEYKLTSADDSAYTTTVPTNAGAYTIRLTVAADDNYTERVTTATFNIAKRSIAISLSDFTYDGTAHAPGYRYAQNANNVQNTLVVLDADKNDKTRLDLDFAIDFENETDVNGNSYVDVGEKLISNSKVTLKGTNASNYNLNKTGASTFTYTITKATAVISDVTAAEDLVYNGFDQVLLADGGSATFGEIEYSLDEEDWETDVDEITADDADTYTVYYRVVGTDNYNGAQGSIEVTIEKKTIVVSATANGKTYDGTTAVTFSNIALDGVADIDINIDEEDDSLLVTIEGAFANADAGNNKTVNVTAVTLYGYSAGNYKLSTEQGLRVGSTLTANIEQKSINGATITLADQTLVYNGSNQTRNVTSVVIDDLNATVDISGNVKTNAGEHTITVLGTGNFTGSATKTWSIAPKPITVVNVNEEHLEVVYGNWAVLQQTNPADYVGLADGSALAEGDALNQVIGVTVAVKGTPIQSLDDVGNVGVYDLYVIANNDNYAVTVELDDEAYLEITKRHIKVTNTNDAKFVITYDENEGYMLYQMEIATLGSTNCEDYVFPFEVTEGSLAEDEDFFDAFEFTFGKPVEQELVPIEGLLGTNQYVFVGEWTAMFDVSNNYEVVFDMDDNFALVVAPKPYYFLPAADQGKTYGEQDAAYEIYNISIFEYDFENEQFVSSVADLRSLLEAQAEYENWTEEQLAQHIADALTPYAGVFTRAAGENAGEYDFAIADGYTFPEMPGSPFASANYVVVLADNAPVYTINAKHISITAENKESTYGEAIVALTATDTGIVEGDALNTVYTLEKAAGNTVKDGGYAITVTVVANANYVVDETTNAVYTINAKAITVTADDKSSTYGEAIVALTATDTGIVEGDALDTVYTLEKAAGNTVKDGGYAITVNVVENANYVVTAVAGVYTINPKHISITAQNKESTYGDAIVALTATDTGIVEGDALDTVYTLTKEAGNTVKAGGYAITVNVVANANYVVDETTNAVYTINKATFGAIAFENAAFTYDGTAKSLAIGTDLNDEISVAYENNGKVNAGTYTVTAKFTVSGNYNAIADKTATLTINKATFGAIAFENAAFTYDGTAKSLAIGTDLNDEISVAYENNGKVNAGTYTVTAKFTVSDNYNAIADKTATLTINAKAITVTADAKSSTYGDAIVALTAVDTGIVKGDALDTVYTLTKEAGNTVKDGGYAITVNVVENANYVVTAVAGVYTINAKAITVTANNVEAIYGEDVKTLTATIAPALVAGDKNADVFTLSTTAKKNSDVGEYPIAVTVKANANYAVTAVAGKYVISEKAEEVDAESGKTTYDKEIDSAVAEETGANVTDLFKKAAANNTENKEITLEVGESNIVFDAAAINELATAEDLTLKLSFTEEIPEEDAAALKGAQLVIDVSLGGATFANGKATVTVPFDGKVPTGKKAVVYYVDESGNREKMHTTAVDGGLAFETNHFSRYIVVYELTAGTIAGIVVACVVFAAGVAVLVIFLLKKKKGGKAPNAEDTAAEAAAASTTEA